MFKPKTSRACFFSTTGPVALALDFLLRVMEDCSQLEWGGNPWQHPPAEVMGQRMSGPVRQYFNAVFAAAVTTVQRPLKVVIVGKEAVGKTRCVYRKHSFVGHIQHEYIIIEIPIVVDGGKCMRGFCIDFMYGWCYRVTV